MISSIAGDSYAYNANISEVPELFICENDALERLLLNRRQAPLDFVNNCRDASCHFLRHIDPTILNDFNSVAELQILTKGYYYWLHNAVERVYGENLPINFAATNRVGVDEDGVHVKVHFTNFDAPADVLIIGDTIASGETICAALNAYLIEHSLSRLVVLSYAGSIVGAKRIASFCQRRSIEVIFLYGLAAFGLAQNGFDLSFAHNETLTHERYKALAHVSFGGLGISVAGWDFGSQSQSPAKYQNLSRVEAHYWGFPDSEVFPPASGLIDETLIGKERSAFSSRIRDVSRLK